MWANPIDLKDLGLNIHLTRKRDLRDNVASISSVAVIPLDDIEALVEKAYSAYWAKRDHEGDGIRAALTAVGIPCKRKASR